MRADKGVKRGEERPRKKEVSQYKSNSVETTAEATKTTTIITVWLCEEAAHERQQKHDKNDETQREKRGE